MRYRRRSVFFTTTRSTAGSVSLVSATGSVTDSESPCAATAAQASTSIAAKFLKIMRFRSPWTSLGRIIASDPAPAMYLDHSSPSPAVSHVLDARNHDLHPGPQLAEIDIGVVLHEQPFGQELGALGDRPERVPGTRDVDLGARNAVRGEVGRLQLAVILVPVLLEDIVRHLVEIELEAMSDQHRFGSAHVIQLAQVLRAHLEPVGVVPERLLGGDADRVVASH